MSRLVIDVSGEQHQKIKVLAALQGKTIKDYVFSKLIPEDESEGEAWAELNSMLLSRIEAAERDPPAQQTFEQLTREIIKSKRSS